MKKKNYGMVIMNMLLVWAVVGWMTFNSNQESHPAVEYRAVCRGLPTNAHWTDGSTRKEIPQTETSPNVREPSPVGTYGTSTGATECHFVCDDGYERKNEECKVPLIVHNPDAGTISITNGTTTYVLADRNVWATEVYDGTNCISTSCPQSVAGYVFQRGNNHGFTGTIADWNTTAQAGMTTNSSQIAWRASHSTWITTNPRYSGGGTGSLRGNSNSTQWPCLTGRHVPTREEWVAIFNALSGTAQSDFARTDLLKLPPAGIRNYFDASAYRVGSYGYYRSSSPYSDVNYAYDMYFDSFYVDPQNYTYRSIGFSVRCLQNS